MENTKIGIIGGGQLGLLLTQAAIQFPCHVSIYDPDEQCSAAPFTRHFTRGAFDDYEALMEFGRQNHVLIFETEKVNVQALFDLQKMGKRVVSSPATLEWIQDKGLQKEKLRQAGLPISGFQYVDKMNVRVYDGPFPIVQKWRKGGYDGYGVKIHSDKDSILKADERDSIFEEAVQIEKEISILIARNEAGDMAVYPPVEMVFEPQANLVDYLISPARLDDGLNKKLQEIVTQAAEKLQFVGIYAIEFFIDRDQKIYINEISPRPHNSGHHTISAHVTSQYEQQVRIALGLPLGATTLLSPCVLVNLLADQSTGKTHYKGIEAAYRIPHVQYTFYGKEEVRPFRKMGHAVILENDIELALKRATEIRNTLTITTYES